MYSVVWAYRHEADECNVNILYIVIVVIDEICQLEVAACLNDSIVCWARQHSVIIII